MRKSSIIKIMESFSLKKKIFRSLFIILLFVGIIVLGYFVLVWTGLWESVNSVEKIKSFILGFGFYGRLAFVILQFLQVTILPIPSAIITVAGSIIYGPLQATLLSLAGILLGSFFAFLLGRSFGKKIVNFMVGKETCDKMRRGLSQAKYSFLVMMLLPFFPDDILCLVAGMTDMSWDYFAVVQIISRPIGILITCYVGSGELIPYHGWGLIVWGIIIAVVLVILILTTKYKDNIEKFMLKLLKKKKN